MNLLTNFRLVRAGEIAKENLKDSQTRMKVWYDRNAKSRVFGPDEKVLVLFPIPGDPLRARYSGPYEIETKLSDVDYVVKTPGTRKQRQLCHINMLKKYVVATIRSVLFRRMSTLQSLQILRYLQI